MSSRPFNCLSCKRTVATLEGNNISILGNASIVSNFPPSNWNSNWLKCSNCNQFAVMNSAQNEHQQKMVEMKRQHELALKKQQQEYMRQQRQQQQQRNIQQRRTLNVRKNQLVSDRQRIMTNELYPIQSQISSLNHQIVTEEKECNFVPERKDKTNRIIVLIGNVGDGKSTLGNRLSGDTSLLATSGPFQTSNGNQSCTRTIQKHTHNKRCIVDCPGWNDTGGNDNSHRAELCRFLKGCGGINAFIVVRNGTNCRFDVDFQRKLQHLSAVFGSAFWKHLVIVLTHVDKGMRETQFRNSNASTQLKQDISKLCRGANNDVPVIAVGLDNYSGNVPMILNMISFTRFDCKDIKSSIDEWKAKKKGLINQQYAIQQRINAMSQNISNVDRQISAVPV